MATTITVSERTRQRLADYKRGDQTFDDVLNTLMDRVAVEDIAVEQIAEHYRRLKDFKGIPRKEFSAYLERRIKARARRAK